MINHNENYTPNQLYQSTVSYNKMQLIDKTEYLFVVS